MIFAACGVVLQNFILKSWFILYSFLILYFVLSIKTFLQYLKLYNNIIKEFAYDALT